MTDYDVYISYSKDDTDWVQELVEEVELQGLKVCWSVRDFDKNISANENRSQLVERCTSCLLVFSRSYCKRASEWSFFTKFLNTGSKQDKHSIKDVLEKKAIICVYLSECNIPSLFSKQKMLKWTEVEYSDIFWKRLVKYLKSAKKKVHSTYEVKKVLESKFSDEVNDSIQISEIQELPKYEDNLDKSNKYKSLGTNSTVVQIDSGSKIAINTKKMYISNNNDYTSKCPNSQDTDYNETSHKENSDINQLDKKQLQFLQIEKNEDKIFNDLETPIDAKKNNSDTTSEELYSPAIQKCDTLGEIQHKNDDKENDLITASNYEMFNTVYPHLVSSSFCAEDEDLTKEDVEKLTLKMEDMETIMLLNETSSTDINTSLCDDAASYKSPTKEKSEFDSQHEQMQILDILQSLHERIQFAMDKMKPTVDCVSRKKRYRRLLQRYQDCIIKVVNGKKDTVMLQSLPLVSNYIEEIEDQCKCYCCGNLYHSQRALELHLAVCVKDTWTGLLQRKSKK